MQMTVNLTAKEQKLYDAIREGMDEPGSGWLHELAPETKETAGVLGSLVKKGLVRSIEDDDAYWVEIVN